MSQPSDKSTLYVFSGLPGTGKTVLSRRLAMTFKATHIRIDTLEQALRDVCGITVQGEGYELAYRLATDNLCLGLSVVADSCNPIELTRSEWETVARKAEARCVNIEIICSDKREHRRRVESREATVAGLILPTWNEVETREYHDWTKDRIVVDTARKTEDESVDELLSKLATSDA
jgi:predicted kinase